VDWLIYNSVNQNKKARAEALAFLFWEHFSLLSRHEAVVRSVSKWMFEAINQDDCSNVILETAHKEFEYISFLGPNSKFLCPIEARWQ
jgi:hypothetical protein